MPRMKITLLTIFPDFFLGRRAAEGMILAPRARGRARGRGVVGAARLSPTTPHRTTDDYPFGGGVGMIMKVEPIDRALASLAGRRRADRAAGHARRAALAAGTARSPRRSRSSMPGSSTWCSCAAATRASTSACAEHLDRRGALDRRLRALGRRAGGAVRASTRWRGCCRAWWEPSTRSESDSFHSGLLDAPYYTRPADYRGWKVPEVLLSGHHARDRARRGARSRCGAPSSAGPSCSRPPRLALRIAPTSAGSRTSARPRDRGANGEPGRPGRAVLLRAARITCGGRSTRSRRTGCRG
mgnify:CR=1 FL=1